MRFVAAFKQEPVRYGFALSCQNKWDRIAFAHTASHVQNSLSADNMNRRSPRCVGGRVPRRMSRLGAGHPEPTQSHPSTRKRILVPLLPISWNVMTVPTSRSPVSFSGFSLRAPMALESECMSPAQ